MFQKVFGNWKIWGHALLVAVIAAVVSSMDVTPLAGMTHLMMMTDIALATALTYLVKHVFTQGLPNGSSLFSLSPLDILYTIFQTVGSGLIVAVVATLQTHGFPSLAELGTISWAAVQSGLIYLVKNFMTNSQGAMAIEPPATPLAK